MKKYLKGLVRRARDLPFVGPVVAITIALYRLPFIYRHLAHLDERLAHLEVRFGLPGQETEAPSTNEDIQNLILSTPIALRKLRRDVDLLLRHYHLDAESACCKVETEQ